MKEREGDEDRTFFCVREERERPLPYREKGRIADGARRRTGKSRTHEAVVSKQDPQSFKAFHQSS